MIFENPENLTLITEVITTADTFTNGFLGLGIWLLVMFGSLMLTSNFPIYEQMIASSFVVMVLSFFLRYLGLIGDYFLWLPVIVFVGAIIFGSVKGSNGA